MNERMKSPIAWLSGCLSKLQLTARDELGRTCRMRIGIPFGNAGNDDLHTAVFLRIFVSGPREPRSEYNGAPRGRRFALFLRLAALPQEPLTAHVRRVEPYAARLHRAPAADCGR
eukprot:6997232-Prymnesium_polylepis.1